MFINLLSQGLYLNQGKYRSKKHLKNKEKTLKCGIAPLAPFNSFLMWMVSDALVLVCTVVMGWEKSCSSYGLLGTASAQTGPAHGDNCGHYQQFPNCVLDNILSQVKKTYFNIMIEICFDFSLSVCPQPPAGFMESLVFLHFLSAAHYIPLQGSPIILQQSEDRGCHNCADLEMMSTYPANSQRPYNSSTLLSMSPPAKCNKKYNSPTVIFLYQIICRGIVVSVLSVLPPALLSPTHQQEGPLLQ